MKAAFIKGFDVFFIAHMVMGIMFIGIELSILPRWIAGGHPPQASINMALIISVIFSPIVAALCLVYPDFTEKPFDMPNERFVHRMYEKIYTTKFRMVYCLLNLLVWLTVLSLLPRVFDDEATSVLMAIGLVTLIIAMNLCGLYHKLTKSNDLQST